MAGATSMSLVVVAPFQRPWQGEQGLMQSVVNDAHDGRSSAGEGCSGGGCRVGHGEQRPAP